MGEVVLLATAREARDKQQLAASLPPTTQELFELILAVGPKHLRGGALTLLLRIAQFLQRGRVELSYRLLSRETGLCRSTLFRYLDELEEKEFIRIRRSRLGKMSATNQFEIDFNGPLGGDVMLRQPRSTKNLGSTKMGLPTQKQRIGVVPEVDGYKNIDSSSNLISKEIRRSAPQFNSIADAVEKTAKRTADTRARKVLRAASQFTLAGVKATWATAMLKHYPSVPAVVFSAREFAIFKMKMQPIQSSSSVPEFFDYVVSNWEMLRSTKFAWLRAKGKDLATAPSLPELMRYWRIFAQAFSDSRMQEAGAADKIKTTPDQAVREELAKARAAQAARDAENALLRERLAKAERAAYRRPTALEEVPSLSARRKAADAAYNDDSEIPTWGRNDKG